MFADAVFYTECGGRPKNEDAVVVAPGANGLIALVADGLGGMGDGELASQDAVQFLHQQLIREKVTESALQNAISEENQRICAMQAGGKSMMTTIAALWMDGEKVVAATVGDTRIYQFRENNVLFQSTDHSAAQMAVQTGEISPAQIRNHPAKNRLTRALGANDQVKVDVCTLEATAGDCFLLCTDGFWGLITEEEMSNACTPNSTAECWLLAMRQVVLGRATEKGDNHSAVAVILKQEGQA